MLFVHYVYSKLLHMFLVSIGILCVVKMTRDTLFSVLTNYSEPIY